MTPELPRSIGLSGEAVAADFLVSLGYTIKDQNFTSRYGELDIVAFDPAHGWVFVEVKAYKPGSLLDPLEAITRSKIQKLLKTVRYYQLCKGSGEDPARFDVIVVESGRVKDHLISAITL